MHFMQIFIFMKRLSFSPLFSRGIVLSAILGHLEVGKNVKMKYFHQARLIDNYSKYKKYFIIFLRLIYKKLNSIYNNQPSI